MTGLDAPRSNWPADVLIGLGVYAVTALPVALGLALATTPGMMTQSEPPDLATACCRFDGAYYADTVAYGYWHEHGRQSRVVFFPGHPLAAWCVARLFGWDARTAVVVTANVAFAAALVLLSAYLRARYPADPPAVRLAVLGLVGFWPAGFFFRMGYSEGVFLLSLSLVLLGLARRWPAAVLAVLAGAATAVRPVGVAATAAVVVSVLADPDRGSWRRRVLTAAGVGVVGCWGLLAFMGYLYARYDDPLAYAAAQRHWSFHTPGPNDIPSKWLRLAVAEPVWNAYVPGSSRHWTRYEPHGVGILGLLFWNPLLFVLAVVAVAVGWWRGWLNRPEAVLGLGLLVIPYLTRADETSMGAQARFAAVIVPAFVVLGRGLARLPPWATWAVFATLSPVLAVWTALFAAGWSMC